MVNHYFDKANRKTFCGEFEGGLATLVSTPLLGNVSCNECNDRLDDLGVGDLEHDPVTRPSHYLQLPVEAIEITEHFNFTLGNALKYILRADHKGRPIEDLEKARWYLDREIARRKRA